MLVTGAVAVVVAPSCASRRSAPNDAVDAPITVFAASSLAEAFGEIGDAYMTAYPGRRVTFSFAASSSLVAQINEGAPADVVASADERTLGRLVGGTIGSPVVFAVNRLEIIVQQGNPRGITGLADLARPGIVYVAAAPDVPIGNYAQQVLARAGVNVKPKSLEASVKGVVSKVTLGEADAGIVYATDVLAAGARAMGIAIPAEANVIANYPIAVSAASRSRAAAAAFVAFVLSPASRKILSEHGFLEP